MSVAPTERSMPERLRRLAAVLSIPLIVATTFAPGLSNGYVGWDDLDYIRDNPRLTAPDGLWRIWSTFESPQYYPLTFTSYWLEHHLWGDDPTGYYVVNVALHALVAVLVFFLARALGASAWAAWLAAALFALHPLQVASVAWLAERKNVLSGAFALAAFLAYLRHRATSGWASYVTCLALFVAALLSKTAVMLLPLSMWAAERFILQRRGWGGLWRTVPMLALAGGAALVTLAVEQAPSTVTAAWPLRPFAAAAAVWFYLAKIVAPWPLLALYPKWTVSLAAVQWWLAIPGLIALAGAGWHWRRRLGGMALWGAAHFVIALAPTLGLVPFGFLEFSPAGDHFVYLAIIGPFVALSRGICGWAAAQRATALRRRFTQACILAVLATLGTLTWRQVQVWHDPNRFWSHTLRYYPESAVAHTNLGLHLERRGDLDSAFGHYAAAVAADPDYPQAHNNLGAVYLKKGDLNRALNHCEQARRLRPTFAEAYNNLGSIYAAMGRFAEAASFCAEAVRLKPDLAEAQSNLGAALFELGRVDQAIVHYREALRLNAEDVVARFNLANALAARGETQEAVARYREALASRPAWTAAEVSIAWTLATWEHATPADVAEALRFAEQACAHTQRRDAWALDALAAAYAAAGRFEEAAGTAQEARAAAQALGQSQLARNIEDRIGLYRAGRAFRRPTAAREP